MEPPFQYLYLAISLSRTRGGRKAFTHAQAPAQRQRFHDTTWGPPSANVPALQQGHFILPQGVAVGAYCIRPRSYPRAYAIRPYPPGSSRSRE